ncbi:hypothetical protein CYG49_00940 [Candidatus Saccharibacteria bacterium]|nr:MAG: hypothetical protein CYG49_00940 [Candidatus Saccharibacteria bacterium]
MSSNVAGRGKTVARLIISLVLIALALWIFFHRQWIIDQVMLLRYTPSAEVSALADRSSMTDEGKRYFFASRPEVHSATTFNERCRTRSEQSVVLGCYTLQRIYLFDVTDERLEGVKEVTAAHEMLHAAYDRLGPSERERVNALIQAEIDKVSDQRILELIKLYEKTEPGEKLNEMHSILATESQQLAPELEEYYRQYFDDRSAVVALTQQYESVFASIKETQSTLLADLQALNATVKQRSDALNASIVTLNNDIATFNQRARSGQFSSQAEFNAGRSSLMQRQEAMQQEHDSINRLIEQYNRKRDELIALNSEAESLNQSLDSTPNEVPSF